eukprot:scaffold870_cov393-Prasinococcus_capsulatus_cf.AAC.42
MPSGSSPAAGRPSRGLTHAVCQTRSDECDVGGVDDQPYRDWPGTQTDGTPEARRPASGRDCRGPGIIIVIIIVAFIINLGSSERRSGPDRLRNTVHQFKNSPFARASAGRRRPPRPVAGFGGAGTREGRLARSAPKKGRARPPPPLLSSSRSPGMRPLAIIIVNIIIIIIRATSAPRTTAPTARVGSAAARGRGSDEGEDGCVGRSLRRAVAGRGGERAGQAVQEGGLGRNASPRDPWWLDRTVFGPSCMRLRPGTNTAG